MKLNKRLDKLEAQRRPHATVTGEEYFSADDIAYGFEIVGHMELMQHYEEIKANTEREEQKEPPGHVEYNSDFLAWVPLELAVRIRAGWFERSKVERAYRTVAWCCQNQGLNFEDEKKRLMDCCLSGLEFLDRLVRADRVPYIDWFEAWDRRPKSELEERGVQMIRKRVERIRQWKIALGVDNRWVRDVPTWAEYVAAQQNDN